MITFDAVLEKLQAKFSSAILGKEDTKPDPVIKVDPAKIREIITYFRDELQFETLGCLSGVDYPKLPALCAVYHLQSYAH